MEQQKQLVHGTRISVMQQAGLNTLLIKAFEVQIFATGTYLPVGI
jgi:hypothetical protein